MAKDRPDMAAQLPAASVPSPNSPSQIPKGGKSIAAGADELRLKEVFPKAQNLFRPASKLEDIIKDCIYVLDASFLLSPFDAGTETLDEVRRILERLTNEKKIRIPAQAVREYVERRTTKTSEIYSDLVRRRDELCPLPSVDVRVLQTASKYSPLLTATEAVNKAVEAYKASLDELIQEFKEWTWRDPVTQLYNQVFKSADIIEHQEKDEELQADFKRRCEKLIPPGYDDAGKQEGIGDVIIWSAILQIGRSNKKNVVFVTNDRKSDWWARSQAFSQNQFHPIAVRFELVNEFYDATGKDFGLIDFAGFLRIHHAKEKVVREAENAAVAAQTESLEADDRRANLMKRRARIQTLAHRLARITREYLRKSHVLSHSGVSPGLQIEFELAKFEGSLRAYTELKPQDRRSILFQLVDRGHALLHESHMDYGVLTSDQIDARFEEHFRHCDDFVATCTTVTNGRF